MNRASIGLLVAVLATALPAGASVGETAAPALDWLNKGVFTAVGARAAAGVIYDTYLVE